MTHDGDQPYECLFVLWWLFTAFFTCLALVSAKFLLAGGCFAFMLLLGILVDVKTKGRFSAGGFPFGLLVRFYRR